jgi:hypothetical protein
LDFLVFFVGFADFRDGQYGHLRREVEFRTQRPIELSLEPHLVSGLDSKRLRPKPLAGFIAASPEGFLSAQR